MDHFIVFVLGLAFGALLIRLLEYAMASQENPRQEEKDGLPLYGHNLLEWRKGDKVDFLKIVAAPSGGEGKVGETVLCHNIGWFNSTDGTVGFTGGMKGIEAKGDWLFRITDKTRNLSLEARKAQAEIEKAKKEAEATMIQAEEFQRLQQEQA